MDPTRLPTKGSSMSRHLLLAATAALLLAGAARAEAPKKDAAPVDPKVDAMVKAAVEKAKQEMREELRAGLQETQSRAEFLGTAAEGPKLQFLELDGYLRVRGDLLDNMGLKRGQDPNGEYLVPPLYLTDHTSGTQSTANMRLRLEPTVNVSEHVRVRVQADVLDDYVLGETATPTSSGGAVKGAAPQDRPVIDVKRAWGEVETPVGLLSFGRMPAAFGMGLVHADATGLDDDYGDNRDRLQFATLPLSTPGGPLSLVAFLDFDAEGTLQTDTRFGAGAGQPWDLDNGDDGRTIGLKLLRLDTDAELRRKLARGESSTNFGLMYLYSTQRMVKNPYWTPPPAVGADPNFDDEYLPRKEYRHQLSLWARHRSPRLAVELEVAAVGGQIGDPGQYSATVDYLGGQLLLRQMGAALKAAYQVMPNKLTLGGEIGFATGDPAPGFGNRPWQISPTATSSAPVTEYGVLEGPQYDPARGDRVIRNFRFNPAYRVDLILWREILGQVTDAFYVKPTLRWDVLSGLAVDAQLVYSQALYDTSTPSATATQPGNTPLGVEFDTKVAYTTDDGFASWLQYGVLFPLSGFDGEGGLTRGHALRAGLAIKF